MKIPKTLLQAIRYFSDPQVCEDYMRETDSFHDGMLVNQSCNGFYIEDDES